MQDLTNSGSTQGQGSARETPGVGIGHDDH